VLYEELMKRYPVDAHPFFLVRKADLLVLVGGGAIAVNLYNQARSMLSSIGIIDKSLETRSTQYTNQVNEQVNTALVRSQQSSYHQIWKPTREHKFPTNLPYLPPGSQEVKDQWQALTLEGSTFFASYLKKLAIETNHVESTFLLSEGSTQDLIRRGISEGAVNYLPESALKDPVQIRSILNDTLGAYNLLNPLVANVEGLDRATICRIHGSLMKTCRFSDMCYIPAGITRTETRRTVIVSGTYNIQCCPFPEVDAELEYICKMAKQWIKTWKNPFATASWIHLVLVRCHPFDDGNGRLVRLLASVPLMKQGFPPISISLDQRTNYYSAINKAYNGDHSALTECMLLGMKETIASVQSL